MRIGSVTSTNSMSGMQMITAGSTDPKIKKYENEITNVQQQMQKLSSKEDLSVNEKTTERQKLQKEISSLNTELKRHQEELSRSQKREAMMAELREVKEQTKEEKSEDKIQSKEASSDKTDEKNLSIGKQQSGQGTVIVSNSDGIVILKEENQADKSKEAGITEKKTETTDNDIDKDNSLSPKETHAMVSADSSLRQAGRQRTIITKTRDGIAILKGEMRQDEKRGVDTEKNQAKIEKMEKQEQRATAFQFSTLGEAHNTMKSVAGTNVTGIEDGTQVNAGNSGFNNPFINALNVTQQEGQASQQRFFVSLGH